MVACEIMSAAGRASRGHLRRLAALPLALAACLAIAACGGSGHAAPTPAKLVSQTESASSSVQSGRIALDVTLKLDGVKQLGGNPVQLDVSGPFTRTANALETDLDASVAIGSSSAHLALDLLPDQVYLGIDGTFYKLPGHVSQATGATGATGALGALGMNIKGWLEDPRSLGTAEVGGVQTDHLSAKLNVAKVLAQAAKLLGASGIGGGATGALGALGGATGASGALGALGALGPSAVLSLVGQAITSARVDVYTGTADHIVRELKLAVAFAVPSLASGALGGLTGGSLDLDATLTQLNQRQTITAPASSQPASGILNGIYDLESQFGSLASLFAGSTGSLAS